MRYKNSDATIKYTLRGFTFSQLNHELSIFPGYNAATPDI